MITCNYIGSYPRLGNQMFQYATLYSVAKEKKYDFGFPSKSTGSESFLRDCFLNLTAKNSDTVLQKHQYNENDVCYKWPYFDDSIFKISDETNLSGYFQTEKYFSKYRQNILKEFEFKSDIKNKCLEIKKHFNKEIVAVHIRLSDYLVLQDKFPIQTANYYASAFENMPKNVEYLLFSDDVARAKQILNQTNKQFYIMNNTNQYVDMCMMTICDYHIIANSTFSWWGAWLSDSKKVIAPRKWFGDNPSMPKDWSDIYCKDWLIL